MNDHQRLFIGNLLGYAAQRNLSPERLCKLSGIDLTAVTQRTSAVITPKQLNDLWLNMVHLSHDPLLGLHAGESLQLAALGIVGQLIQSSRTVGEALTHAAQFSQLLTELFAMEVTPTDDSFTIRFIPHVDREREFPFMVRQMLDLSMAFVLHEVDGLMLTKLKPNAVLLPGPLPDFHEYARVLRCLSTQRADEYALVFNRRYWDEAILTATYEWQQVFSQKVTTLSNASVASPLLKDRILRFLTTNAYLGIPTVEEIAANFNTSSRSLQRKLQDEGVTYQQLADSMRKLLALDYLKSGKYPIKEIFYLLGYNELSAFSRAFKRWTGSSPIALLFADVAVNRVHNSDKMLVIVIA